MRWQAAGHATKVLKLIMRQHHELDRETSFVHDRMSTTLCELCTDFLSQWRNNGFSNGIPPAQTSHATRWMTIMAKSVKWDQSSREPEQEQATVFKHQEIGITQRNAANQSCGLCAAIAAVACNSRMSSDHLISFQVNEKEFHILTGESSEKSFKDIGRSFLV